MYAATGQRYQHNSSLLAAATVRLAFSSTGRERLQIMLTLILYTKLAIRVLVAAEGGAAFEVGYEYIDDLDMMSPIPYQVKLVLVRYVKVYLEFKNCGPKSQPWQSKYNNNDSTSLDSQILTLLQTLFVKTPSGSRR
ncbi:hypothetical protein CEXT_130741 [Caerostris extrusa]|uniref:Uncharacterized protein n=1 Tax=Caerostris extrusa TaxID=172846 RepID=A0AAV4VG99_CAEEX|nr:hypothetical protein CEXT_130741 [Caerostris extrusa]